MKKFYTLLAAAAVTVSASAMQVAPKALEATQATKEMAKSFVVPATVETHSAFLRSLPNDQDITGTYYLQSHLEYTGGSEDEMGAFTLEAGAQQGHYIVKGLYWGQMANDLEATLQLLDYGTQQIVALVIPSGQVWVTLQGNDYKIYPGCYTAQGWGADFTEGTEDAALMFGFTGESFIPLWGFEGVADDENGIAYATPSGNSYSGNVLTNIAMYWANGTFDALVTEDGETAEEYQDDVYVEQAFSRGRLVGVNVYGIAGLPGVLELRKTDVDGQLLAVDSWAADFYKDQNRQELTPAYFTNAPVENQQINDMTVNATCSVANGKTFIDFGDYLVVWIPELQALGMDFYEPTITCTKDFEMGGAVAINNVAVDAVDANVPVEYFNIQGQRIDNPANGQLVIRRQGSKVEKLIVR